MISYLSYVWHVIVLGQLNLPCVKKIKIQYIIPIFIPFMTYVIIFWSNSTHIIHFCRLQKRVIRIITNSKPGDSCRQLFKKLGILPLMSQYIFSLLLIIVNNKVLFQINFEIHSINIRYNSDFHQRLVNLTTYKNGT